jgi:glycerate 2-kinase
MRILIAPDKFKGSLGAREVAGAIASGSRTVLSNAEITELPLADGGEGTAEIISNSLAGAWVECPAHNALGAPIKARFGWIETKKLAVMEMSEAAGLRLLKRQERDPTRADTFGVGEMLLQASEKGAQEIIIGLGGSATNDGGFGMARALGFHFLIGDGLAKLDGLKPSSFARPENASDLAKLVRIEKPTELALPKIVAAVDVRNPLLGERGATRIFGPQKGANPKQIDLLEKALTRLADIAAHHLKKDFRDTPGAGAAGGLGFGLMTFCGATVRSGFDVVAEQVKLSEAIERTDVVITGEGSLDRQTLEGKVPAGVAKLARERGKRVFAIVGKSSGDREVEDLFEKVFALARESKTESESIERAAELLFDCAQKLAAAL